MSDVKLVNDLAVNFGVCDWNAMKILASEGERFGHVLAMDVDFRTCVPLELYNSVLSDLDGLINRVPSSVEVAKYASKTIPFKESKWVYFLVDHDGFTVYIGKTTNMARRLGEHVKTKDFSEVYCIEDDDFDDIETLCIEEFNPPLNVDKPPREDLFRRCVRRYAMTL